ncbi:rod shape-determining protein MreC, partial [Patescibacteria group bacterium]|nr:rod shape-determining protein MreC [Patescibacteria group bacterium]
GEDVTMGIIEGEFGLTIKMDFIPQNKRINNEDIVITSGLEKNIPKGLVIGKITRINKNNNEVWQNAIIEPLADLDNLIIVSVLQ